MKSVLLILILYINIFAFEKVENEIYIEYKTNASYEDVIFSLLDEIANQGFILSYRANIGKAVNKTADFFKKDRLFLNANKIGFCKSSLTLEMLSENINNLLFCPLSLGIYEIKKNHIKIIYQKAKVLNNNNKIMKEVNRIINNIIIKSISNVK